MGVDYTEIKRRLDIVDVAQRLGLQIKGRGAKRRARCPHQSNPKGQAIELRPQRQGFSCYRCQEYGSALDLIAHVQGVDLEHAAELAAGWAGLSDAESSSALPPLPRPRLHEEHELSLIHI